MNEQTQPPLRPLPREVADLLCSLQAPPRLAAHLRLVHDVAWTLLDAIANCWAALTVNRTAVLFGATTHDIGKGTHVAELAGAGSRHETAGRSLLLDHGFPDALARFAETRGSCDVSGATVEDLLVSLADKIWKGERVSDLETLLATQIAKAVGAEAWQVFVTLDEVLVRLTDSAEERLSYQVSHPLVLGGT